MSTICAAVDFFIDPKSKVTGQTVENCGERNVIRRRPEYLDDHARKNMNEFSTSSSHMSRFRLADNRLTLKEIRRAGPVEVINRTLSVEDLGLEVV
jgi:hypothetical protein